MKRQRTVFAKYITFAIGKIDLHRPRLQSGFSSPFKLSFAPCLYTNFVLSFEIMILWNKWAYNFTKPDKMENCQDLRRTLVDSCSPAFHTKLPMHSFVSVVPFSVTCKFVALYMVSYSENFRGKRSSSVLKTIEAETLV